MNAYGFACWYGERTPLEARMAEEFHKRWRMHNGLAVRAEAEVDDVPAQADFIVKNTATLALQLIKRFRNICYTNYAGRIPPSVMLSFYAGAAATPNTPLSAMVIRIANWIIADIEEASEHGRKLHVANPSCDDDVFTDRWPESATQQNEFANHLRDLVRGLELMQQGSMPPNDMIEWLRERMGDRIVTRAVENITAEVGSAVRAGAPRYSANGSLIIPRPAIVTGVVGTAANAGVAAATPRTFFGVKV